MKVLDRYLVRELIKPVMVACAVLVLLVLIADLFDNLDEFLKNKISIGVIGQYYLALIPFTFIQILPWAAWLGTLFLLVTFGAHNEIIAMKAVGLKITAIIRPVFFVGILLGVLSWIVYYTLVPQSYRVARSIKQLNIEKKEQSAAAKDMQSVTYMTRNGQLFYFRNFSPQSQKVEDVHGLWLDPEHNITRRKMMARRGQWKENQWVFSEVTEYNMDSRGRVLGDPKTFPKKTYSDIEFTPEQLTSVSREVMYLNYKELKDSIHQLRENGIRVDAEAVELQARLAAPWQALVMMLICTPLLAKTTNRKLIAYNVLLCVILVFSFNVVTAVAMALGKAGKIFPFLGAWFGNILFSFIGILKLEKANY